MMHKKRNRRVEVRLGEPQLALPAWEPFLDTAPCLVLYPSASCTCQNAEKTAILVRFRLLSLPASVGPAPNNSLPLLWSSPADETDIQERIPNKASVVPIVGTHHAPRDASSRRA